MTVWKGKRDPSRRGRRGQWADGGCAEAVSCKSVLSPERKRYLCIFRAKNNHILIMPSSRTRIRSVAEDFSLVLKTGHNLAYGAAEGPESPPRRPDSVDVLAAAVVVLTMSGIWNRTRVSDAAVLNSALAAQVLSSLQAASTGAPATPELPQLTVVYYQNAGQLGLDAMSKLYTDDTGRTARMSPPLLPHMVLRA